MSVSETSQRTRSALLIVDDDDLLCWSLREELRWQFPDLACHTVSRPEDARTRVAELTSLRVVLSDVHFPDDEDDEQGGIALVRWLRRRRPEVEVILMSAMECPLSPREAEALRLAAFLEKPFELDRLVALLARLLEIPSD